LQNSVLKRGGCELLEKEYIGALHKMRYKCSCGSISEINLANFKQGQRCKICGHKKMSKTQSLTLECVEQYFKYHDCKLLEKTYKNSNTKMRYICSCGGINKITFGNFKSGKRCKKCGGKEKLTLEYVEQYFKKQNCKLLVKKYINNSTKMKYRCSCGNINKITFSHFKKGQRCMKCASKSRSGENNHNYNPNLTDEERENNKSRYSDYIYIRWIKYIYKKDNYICQKCLQKDGRLNAHHIKGYSNNKNLRTNKNNGIVMCSICHIKFHKAYGYKNNDQQQLEDYFNRKL
jgi:hypothetical protein